MFAYSHASVVNKHDLLIIALIFIPFLNFTIAVKLENSKSAVIPDDVVVTRLVKNTDFRAWHQASAKDSTVYQNGDGSLVVLQSSRRDRRQNQDEKSGEVTPVLPIHGEKKYNDIDCMPWTNVAAILRSSIHPKDKQALIEPFCCSGKMGLECVPIEERGGIVNRCRCMLVYGPKPVFINYTESNGKTYERCFLPAGLGYDSECHQDDWSNFGYPHPYGDPAGANAEAASQTDAWNKPGGEQLVIDYIRWNAIIPKCVPNAECQSKGTYIGQRCQCKKGSELKKPEGTCSSVDKMGNHNYHLYFISVIVICKMNIFI